jgi:hypothetical protein
MLGVNCYKARNKTILRYSAKKIAPNETASGCAGQDCIGNLIEYIEAFETCVSWAIISQ